MGRRGESIGRLLLGLVLAACAADGGAPAAAPPDVLVFTRTEGFRHDSIPAAASALRGALERDGLTVELADDPATFADERLDGVRAVVFLLTTGDVLDPPQEEAFERYLRAGGGYAGIHSASDTEYEWPFYGEVVGAYFARHPPGVHQATVVVEDRTHASTRHLPSRWTRPDEWYDFRTAPRDAGVHVLAAVDESTYDGGGMGSDHPVAWCHAVDDGRAWYTAGGHDSAAWADDLFVAHVAGGVRYAAGAEPACG